LFQERPERKLEAKDEGAVKEFAERYKIEASKVK
jgi:hypothetical protein